MTLRTVFYLGAIVIASAGALSVADSKSAAAEPQPKLVKKLPNTKDLPRIGPIAPKDEKAPEKLDFGACVANKMGPGGQHKLGTSLTNNTSQAITFQAGEVMASLTRSDWQTPYTVVETIRAPAGGMYLAPGSHGSVFTGLLSLPPGPYTLTWKDDPESLHTPATLPKSKTCEVAVVDAPAAAGAKPDLVVAGIAVSPASGTSTSSYSFEITLRNIGHAASTLSNTTCLLDGYPLFEKVNLVGLAPNATSTRTSGRAPGIIPGSHQLTCTVDPANTLAEERDDNNSLGQSFQVH